MIRPALITRQRRQSIFKSSFSKKQQEKILGHPIFSESSSSSTVNTPNKSLYDNEKKSSVQRQCSQPVTGSKNYHKKHPDSDFFTIFSENSEESENEFSEIDKKRSYSLCTSNELERSSVSLGVGNAIPQSGTSKNNRRRSKAIDNRSSFDFATTVLQAARRASEVCPKKLESHLTSQEQYQEENFSNTKNYERNKKIDHLFLEENKNIKSRDSLLSNISSINSELTTYSFPWRRRYVI
uniref:Uncharacterized protein n=1 Tax=Parastrongyloides trichosuri TaxID=131310 RepID=A0A0N4ZYK2_PARTI